MTSWVLAISKDYPDHWDIAKQEGFWDLRTPRSIEAGDVVYFWRSGGSFAGRVEVTADARELSVGESLPWHDAGETQYRQRFTFTNAREPVALPRWGEVADATGIRQWVSQAPHSDESDVEQALSIYFTVDSERPGRSHDAVDLAYSEARAAVVVLADLERDERARTQAAIAVRRGQGRFRNSLLRAYKKCAVTGTSTESVLEAAHISPYLGEQTNVVPNGLLLRADIHTLFDVHRLTVEPVDNSFVVRVAPDLDDTYQGLEGRLLKLPEDRSQWPDTGVLRRHNDECRWLAGRRSS